MTINRKSKSILEEINSYVPSKNKEDLVENRAQHIIASSINLMNSIDEIFTEEDAERLKKRFISSIRSGDSRKFTRMMARLKNNDVDEELDDDI